MYTTHGYHIPGTVVEYPMPHIAVFCGGVRKCTICIGQAYHATLTQISPEDKIRRVSYMDDSDPQTKARVIVAHYINENQDDTVMLPITLREVHIVWWSKILKNWKAVVGTDREDKLLYEVTYNGHADEIYLDEYDKLKNVMINR